MAYGTVVPTIPAGSFATALGLVGCCIMPHNLYLHSSLVLTRKINTKSNNEIYQAYVYNAIESAFSLGISFFISTAVISTFAAYMDRERAAGLPIPDLDLQTASTALEASFGSAAKYIWAIGLLAAGQSSTMTGTYAG